MAQDSRRKRPHEWLPTRPSEVLPFLTDLRKFAVCMMRLRRLHDVHRGRRCFILGNGPSLRLMDLKPLRNEITFGLNRIYLLFPSLGFATTYLVAVNRLLVEQFGDELANTPCTKLVSWFLRDLMPMTDSTIFVRPGFRERFSHNPVFRGVWEGSTVTFVALQLAYFMGFTQVILIGVDHSFHSHGKPHELVTATGDDLDHFDPGYFGAGIRWNLPDLDTSERAYRLAKEAFEQDGREILDATVGGKLNIFRKVEFGQMTRPL